MSNASTFLKYYLKYEADILSECNGHRHSAEPTCEKR